MNYVRFNTNVPEQVALLFPDGVQVPSKIEGAADQMVYSVDGGRRMYLPLHAAEKIRSLGVKPGEKISVCKAEVLKGSRRGVEWQISRVEPPKQAPVAVAVKNGANGNGANGHAAVNGNGTNGHATANGVPYWDPKAELLRCYDEAIEVLVTARDRSAAKGLPVQFTGEDLRQVAATLYIDAGKDRRTPWTRQN